MRRGGRHIGEALAASTALLGMLAAVQPVYAQASPAEIDDLFPEPTDEVKVDVAADRTDKITVIGQTAVSAIEDVAGGTAVVTIEDLQDGRIANLSDALRNVPGVFAQSVSGGEATRLSIRGSGITKGGFTWGNGTAVLFDGFPITTAFGTPYESFEPNALHHVDVYKGANAFEFGATQLGGVINFVPHTGHTASSLLLRAETGSFGYGRQQISSGAVFGPLDYYVSATHFQTDGYRDNAAADSSRLVANIGYQITPQLSTRFHFAYTEQDQENISALTLAQLNSNPKQNPRTGSRVNNGSYLLANRTDFKIDDHSNLEFGIAYKRPHLYNGNLPQRTFWRAQDWATSLKYNREDTLFGDKTSHTTLAVIHSAALPDSGAIQFNATTGRHTGTVDYDGSNTTVLISNDLNIAPKLWLQTGLAWIRQERFNFIRNPVGAGVNPRLDKTYENYTPRIGVRYEISPDLQIYGNISRLIEAPQIIGYTTSANGVYTGYGANGGLKVQSGTSYEVGVRGSFDRFTWDVAAYHAPIKDELLTIFTTLPSPGSPNGVSATINAQPTIHQGIEASLATELLNFGGHEVSFDQAYTWNDFKFEDQNLAAGRGRLPGLPEHVYQAKLGYRHASGFYASASVDAVLDDYPIDYINQNFAPAYTLVGLNLGFEHPTDGWRLFVQAENLTDETYASFTSATINGTGAAAYTPGVGRSFSAGLSYAF